MRNRELQTGDYFVVNRGPKMGGGGFMFSGDPGNDRSNEGLLFEVVEVSGDAVLGRCVGCAVPIRAETVGVCSIFTVEHDLQQVSSQFAEVVLDQHRAADAAKLLAEEPVE